MVCMIAQSANKFKYIWKNANQKRNLVKKCKHMFTFLENRRLQKEPSLYLEMKNYL